MIKRSLSLVLAVALVAGSADETAANAIASSRPVRTTPAKSRDWTHAVTPTRDGGFMLGNPAAKVKLVEFGSLTCPHCRAFDAEGVPKLLAYVKTGRVSWEFRNYVRDSFDITAALIARCNGPRSFFPLTRALFNDQPAWEGKIEAIPEAQLTPLQNLPPERQFVALAKISGLQAWASGHGLTAARTTECLSNARSVKQLVDMAGSATSQFPDFKGTPAFVINGKMLDQTANWNALEPQLKAALGS